MVDLRRHLHKEMEKEILVYANAVFLENHLFNKFFDHILMLINTKFTTCIDFILKKPKKK